MDAQNTMYNLESPKGRVINGTACKMNFEL